MSSGKSDVTGAVRADKMKHVDHIKYLLRVFSFMSDCFTQSPIQQLYMNFFLYILSFAVSIFVEISPHLKNQSYNFSLWFIGEQKMDRKSKSILLDYK